MGRIERQWEQQLALISPVTDLEREQARWTGVIWEHGWESLRVAANGLVRSWEMRRENLSPLYTTEWNSIAAAEVEEK